MSVYGFPVSTVFALVDYAKYRSCSGPIVEFSLPVVKDVTAKTDFMKKDIEMGQGELLLFDE